MNKGKIYLRVEDLMKLAGTENKRSAYNTHKMIRESIGKHKRNLTILEYCNYTGDDYSHIYYELRGEMPQVPPSFRS